MYRDGICQVADTYYTKMVEFLILTMTCWKWRIRLINILEEYSKLINYFDPSIRFQLFLFNRQVSEQALAEQFDTPLQDDDFNDIREEYAQMLKHQSAKVTMASSNQSTLFSAWKAQASKKQEQVEQHRERCGT